MFVLTARGRWESDDLEGSAISTRIAEHRVDRSFHWAWNSIQLTFGRVCPASAICRGCRCRSRRCRGVRLRAPHQAGMRDLQAPRPRVRARSRRGTAASAVPGHAVAQRMALGQAEILHQVPRGVQRRVVVQQADPECRAARRWFQGPLSAPRISRNFFSRTSGNAVVMWSFQSRSVGSAPGSTSSSPARNDGTLLPLSVDVPAVAMEKYIGTSSR